jgi:hypothetical protein
VADVRDIVTGALQDLGVLAAGEIANAGEAIDGLSALNNLIDQLAAERLAIHQITRTTFAITANAQSYTVGVGGAVAVARPVYPLRVTYYVTANTPIVEITLYQESPQERMANAVKTLALSVPTEWYYEPTIASGFGTLYLWPVPDVSTLTGVFYAPEQVAEFASLSTQILLPPGYRRMLVKNLACEIASSYERTASDDLKAQAEDAMRVVKRSNLRLDEMSFDRIFQEHGMVWNIKVGP